MSRASVLGCAGTALDLAIATALSGIAVIHAAAGVPTAVLPTVLVGATPPHASSGPSTW